MEIESVIILIMHYQITYAEFSLDSPKMFLKDDVRGHEIRTYSDGQDYDLKSLREMNVFDLLKSEKLRPYFSYIHRLDQVDTRVNKEEKFFPTNRKIASEIPKHEV